MSSPCADENEVTLPDQQPYANDGVFEANQKSCDDVSFIYCCKLWLFSLAKALIVVVPVLTFLWMYFLPGLVLSSSQLKGIEPLLYSKLLWVFSEVPFYGFAAIYGVSIFGFYFFRQALFFCLLPGMIAKILFAVFLDLGVLNTAFALLVIIAVIIVVYREKLPKEPLPMLIDEFRRKKQIASPIGKMVTVIFGIVIILRIMFPIFLNAPFRGRIFLRFIALPIVMACCSSLQMHILKSVSVANLDFAIPTIWISNGYLKMWERLFTNGMFSSGDHLNFVATTFAASLLEIVSYATYFRRVTLLDKLIEFGKGVKAKKQNSVRSIVVNQLDGRSNNSEQRVRNTLHDNEWLILVRKKMIIEEVAIELMMVFTVTFLLYFSNPLLRDSAFESIPSFPLCIVQLLIQIVFEMFSDIFGLYWTVTRLHTHIRTDNIQIKNQWSWVWVLFMTFQSLYIFSILAAA